MNRDERLYFMSSLVNFAPFSTRSAISPFWLKTNARMGSPVLVVSSDSRARLSPAGPGVHAELEAGARLKPLQDRVLHEHQDQGRLLNTDRKAERGPDQIVVADGFAVDPERACAVLAPKIKPALYTG